MAKGTITSIRPNRDDGRGFGVIAPDRGGPGFAFDNRSVEGLLPTLARVLRALWRPGATRERPFDRLRAGQEVTYTPGVHPLQPHRAYAECVRPIATRARR